MKAIITLIFLLNVLFLKAQFWIAGDTTGLTQIVINQTFVPDSEVTFDIDCDGITDFGFSSSLGTNVAWPWDRLSLFMADHVEVLNSGIGAVTPIAEGDTVLFDDALWTGQLDFIFGTGELGNYGHEHIAEKYLSFRKNGLDTLYCFIRFSNTAIIFTVHEIFSSCSENPLQVITALNITEREKKWMVYPNPAGQCLNVVSEEAINIRLFDLESRVLMAGNQHNLQFDLSGLPAGVYVVEVQFEDGTRERTKVFRQ
ncbi:MAG: T9SS type A sorting domain-containing protein [Saprospiraceae bacterium]|nr:T9SS type A sorting domain-containing protein [Saprospiraceae bacterium]MCB9325843.1 T9SS type A sorting domain-containing protein [Lewinellaceae bacterium]